MAKDDDTDPVDKARSALAALAPKPPGEGRASIYRAVKALYPDILAARVEKHYLDAELVAMLEENGIPLTLGTFRQYMQRARRELDATQAKSSANAPERQAVTSGNTDENSKTNRSPRASDSAGEAKSSEVATKPASKSPRTAGPFRHKLGNDDV